ncbi:hypothetical protein [Paucisalibacillus globulus]|uniref:hypothetical protein n=1 Tax=Paucisalibacillus globulus TaxID=351095 RepID=UPI0003F57473|nr:hypothetical protein [Paucisalibacillus globulus]
MKNRKNLYLKILGIFSVLIIVFSSIKVTFADQDIASMLSNWLDNKSTQSINEMESSISLKQEEQTTRLKSEIQQAIQAADQQFQDFIENEKIKRVQQIEEYADQLIESYSVTVDSGKDMTQKLECIATNAEIEMDIVMGKKDKSALMDCGVVGNVPKEIKVENSGIEDTESDNSEINSAITDSNSDNNVEQGSKETVDSAG